MTDKTRQEMVDWLQGYIDAFNRNDFEGFGAYYADDVQFMGQAATLTGRAAVLDFYRKVKTKVRETLTVHRVVTGPNRLAIELETELVGLEDWPDFPTGPMMKGDVRRTLNFIFYDIEDGKFSRIRSARYQRLA